MPDASTRPYFNEGSSGASQQKNERLFLAHLGRDGKNQLLTDHLLQVSKLSAQLGAKIAMRQAGELIGLLHDVGKYSQAFQQYLREASDIAGMEMEQNEVVKGRVDHSTAGAQWIWKHLSPAATRPVRQAGELLAVCIASHHSGLIDCVKPDGIDDLTRRMKKADADTHMKEAIGKMDPGIQKQADELLAHPALSQEVDAAFESIRSADPDKIIQPFKIGLLVRMLFSCLIDADRTDTADFEKPSSARLRQHGEYVPWATLVGRLEQHLIGFSSNSHVNALRQQISGHCREASGRPKGIYTLTVPTGGGKTLASLRFALHHAKLWAMDRVIYVSPYISIVDQNAKIVCDVLEVEGCQFASVVLEHHSNLTPDKESWRGGVLAENWDAPIVFTTAVQVLEALFGGGTRSVRRMHALANAIIIFDEVQTLPVRTIHLFNNAVNFLVEQCGASVVLCTATQPLLHEVDKAKGAMRLSADSELMPDAPQLFRDLKRHETLDQTRKPGGWQPLEVANLAVEETLRHGSCLVVVNTKRDALAIYTDCKARLQLHGFDDGSLVYLSTHMCPAHRLQALGAMKKALSENRQVLCVSTQLIEAGVDIDFATVVRDLAGLDSIAQAAGRCNRNGNRSSGLVYIVKLAAPLPKVLEEIRSAQSNASRVLNDWKDAKDSIPFELSDPEQMNTFFTYHFFARSKLMAYPVNIERDDTLLSMLGRNSLATADTWPPSEREGGMMQSFLSAAREFQAIEMISQGVVVPFGTSGKEIIAALCSEQDLLSQFRLLRQAQQYTVNLFPHELLSLDRQGVIPEAQPETGVRCLREGFYSNEFGLDLDGTVRMESIIA